MKSCFLYLLIGALAVIISKTNSHAVDSKELSELYNSNSLTYSAHQALDKTKDNKKYRWPIGVYDIMASVGVNYTKIKNSKSIDEFGTDYDIGITVLNLLYGAGVGMTGEIHFDYTRQNFEGGLLGGSLHVRRQEVYGRVRLITFDATDITEPSRMLGLFLGGLYVDWGYSNALFFNRDVWDDKVSGDTKHSGYFWGYGYNVKYRFERTGFTGGVGVKKYTLNSLKYSATSICMGVTYNIIWNG